MLNAVQIITLVAKRFDEVEYSLLSRRGITSINYGELRLTNDVDIVISRAHG
ncbi:MAG: hypothetical protein ONB42_18830 [candidate division KSB1 bacterium]|nr:hypothetical protein [candidate division KSB1 bacterium]MDZ7313991.1 hypothetical protein [candidate division KSB1 bacterium]